MSRDKKFQHLSALTEKNLLGNFTAFDQNGEFLFNCDHKKANWYVKKNLANWTNDACTHFKLNFKTKGDGNRKFGQYFTEYIDNQCVVCGAKDNLSKHHIVPSCYRSHFPLACKSNDHFDVLLVCLDCHEKVEDHYNKRKKSLNTPHRKALEPEFTKHKELNSIIRQAQKYDDIIEEPARLEMITRASSHDPSLNTWEALIDAELFDIEGNLDHQVCETVVRDERDNLKEFIKDWRKLFIEKAKPEFLPKGWLESHETHFKF